MPLKFNTCPHCNKKIVFIIKIEDIDTSFYPAPAYIFHDKESCSKTSTFYFDSKLGVSYTELEKKRSITGSEIKTIKTLKI